VYPLIQSQSEVSMSDQHDSEWNGLEARWKNLSASGVKEDEKQEQWKTLHQDIQAWATKSGAAIKEHTRAASTQGVATAGLHACPTTDDSVPGYKCFLFPSPKGTCRYVCVPIVIKKIP
jgi:hypothetical protein